MTLVMEEKFSLSVEEIENKYYIRVENIKYSDSNLSGSGKDDGMEMIT